MRSVVLYCVGALAVASVSAMVPATARAEVLGADAGGFSVRQERETNLSPEQAYASFVRIQDWWDSAHTYSGRAGNLRLTVAPGGCWCESLPGGGFVRHMLLEYAAPGKAIRLSGGLGPLQEMGVNGAMTVTFRAKPDGGTILTMVYAVSGRSAGGWPPIASAVDAVLGQQMDRLAALTPP